MSRQRKMVFLTYVCSKGYIPNEVFHSSDGMKWMENSDDVETIASNRTTAALVVVVVAVERGSHSIKFCC